MELLTKGSDSLKKNDFSKLIVLAVVILNSVFTAACLYVFLRTGAEPKTLIGCWFGFTTGELWFLAGITKNKIKKGVKNDKDKLETEIDEP